MAPPGPPPQTQLEWLCVTQADQTAVLNALMARLETMMATLADLTATVQALRDQEATEAQAWTTVQTELTKLHATIAQITAGGLLTTEQQAALDAAVAGITTATADAAQVTASMQTESGPPTP